MARRPRCRLAALLITAVLTACSPGAEETATTIAAATTDTTATSTTLSSPTTSDGEGTTTSTTEFDAEVTVPAGDGPFPAVVLVHGGGWVTGSPSVMRPLAGYLADNGFLTVNARYRLSSRANPGFPGALEDVACAVRFAANHPDSDGTVAIVGHSAGAHIGAVVALNGDDYQSGCGGGVGGLARRFVGLAGPYDVSRLGLALGVFFGSAPGDDPDSWQAGNPLELAGENPDLEALIMFGESDGLVGGRFAVDFHERLLEVGADSLLELVEGARHNDMHDPDVVGDLIVTWLHR